MPDESGKKARKRVVVEEVETPPASEVVSSKELQNNGSAPQIPDEAVSAEVPHTHPHDLIPEVHPNKSFSSLAWWIIIPGIFLLGALLGGIIFYQKGISKGEGLTASPTPATEDFTQTPSPSPAAKLDLTKFSVNILNGSGIAGEAGKAKDLLTTAGFKVSGTGNASSYSFTKTIVKAKSSVDAAFVSKLVETLGKNYSVDKTQTLPDSSTDDVQVVVGSTKAQ